MLPPDFTSFAITHGELVSEQVSDKFRPEMRLALEKESEGDDNLRLEHVVLENEEGILCRRGYVDATVQYVAPDSFIDSLLYIFTIQEPQVIRMK